MSWQDRALQEMQLIDTIRRAFPDQPDLSDRLRRAASERGWTLGQAWERYLRDYDWNP